MKKNIPKIFFDALTELHKAACEYEEIDTTKLSKALNKSFGALNLYVESPSTPEPTDEKSNED